VKALENKLSFIAGTDTDYLERLNLVRYSPGQFFNKHHDGRFRPITIFLYLNDLPEGDGGETFFPRLGLKFTPRKGCAIMWRNTESAGVEDFRLVHQGLPPKTCMKYGVNCFFNAKPVRQWEEPESDEEGAQQYRTVDGAELLKEIEQGVADPAQRLRAFQVFDDPRMVVVPQLLTAAEAETFHNWAINGTAGMTTAVLSGMEARLSAVAGLPESHLGDLNTMTLAAQMLSRPQVMADSKRPGRQPVKAALIFLNEVPDRGELRFPQLGLQVLPRAGCAVVWDVAGSDGQPIERAAHLGRPPTSGVRYVATCVFHDAPVRGL